MRGAIATGAVVTWTLMSIVIPTSITTSTETKPNKNSRSEERPINEVRVNFSTIPNIAKA
jgi:hypothetical protein